MSSVPTISSHLPDLVNAYIQARSERLQIESQVETLKSHEELLKKAVISKMEEQKASVYGTDFGTVKLIYSTEPLAENWEAVWSFIKENDAFDLLHKRLTSTAVKERWDIGIEVPGVGRQVISKLTVSKAK